jgi:hypothetical protein
MLHDPIEDDPALAPLIAKAEAEPEAEIGDTFGLARATRLLPPAVGDQTANPA